MLPSITRLMALAAAIVSQVLAAGPTDSYSDADPAQSGYLPNHNMDPAVVDSSEFGLLWSTKYNAKELFYAKPLVYTPLAGGPQIVFIASSQNWIRTMNAKTGAPLNARQVHTPFLQAEIGCNDIPDTIGIIGTPVIDPATDIAYFFAKTYIPNFRTAGNTGVYNGVYYFHGVNVNTLEDAFPPVLIDGSQSDNAPAKYFIGGVVLQRPALTQIGSVVYTGFGGHCDLFNYTGVVIGVDVNLKKVVTNFAVESGPLVPQTNVWNQNAGGGQGGIWMSGMAMATDGANRLFWVSGNGVGHENKAVPASGSSGCKTLGEAAVNLAVGEGGKLSLTDYFQPYDYEAMDGGDQDFGSGGVVLLDPGTFKGTGVSKIAVTSGKNGKIYFLNANNLGGYKLGPGQTDGILQTIVTNKAVFGGVGSYPLEGGYIYSTPVGYPTYVYKLGFSGSGVPVFSQVGRTPENSAGRVGGGVPVITTNQGKEGTAILWMTDPDAGLRAWHAVPGADGLLKSINIPQVNGLNKFLRPAFGDSRLYVIDAQSNIYCLGSPVNLPLTCSSPVTFGSVALGSSATQTVSCTANIPITRISDVTVGDVHFEVSINDLPQGAVAKGATFTFPVKWNLESTTVTNAQNASYGNTAPGIKSTALTIQTVNGVDGYSSKFPISLTGTQVSQKPFLVIAPITVDYSGVVITDPANIPTVSLPFVLSNAGVGPLTITGYAFTDDELDDNPVFTNVTMAQQPSVLGAGFSSNNLPPVGTVIPGGGEISVDSMFTPTDIGTYTSYFFVYSDGGKAFSILQGSASTAAIANFSISTSEGGWLPEQNIIMDFGKVAPGTTSSRQIRICNEGGSVLQISKSKPPAGVFRPEDPNALYESQNIPVNSCAYATVLFVTNAMQPNTPDQTFTNTWTLNVDDVNFGVREVAITGTVVSRKIGPTNPAGDSVYRYLGCYHEVKPGGRLLVNQAYVSATENTNDRCQTVCNTGNYVFSGTEYQTECYCDNVPPANVYKSDEIFCNYGCSGDQSQTCGGIQVGTGGYISIYYDPTRFTPSDNDTTGTTPTSGTPQTVKQVGDYNYLGCYSETTQGRALSDKIPPIPATGTTLEYCQTACQGYQYFGVEFANECYCGNTINAGSVAQASDDVDVNGCSMLCGGNQTQYCGGANRIEMYGLNASIPVPTSTPTNPTTPTTPTGGPSNAALIGAWGYLGCYTEATAGRALSGKLNPVPGATLTNELCAAACSGFNYFGTEYSGECYCGDTLGAGAVLATDGGCSMTCNGNASEYCGGPNRLTMYKLNTTSTSTSTATGTGAITSATSASATATVPAGPAIKSSIDTWSYYGCMTEATNGRALSGLLNPVEGATLTLEKCAAACAGYTYFGTEYSGECYCGNTFGAGSILATGGNDPAASGCSMLCNGDKLEYCGGPNRLSTYKASATLSGSSSTTTTATSAGTSAGASTGASTAPSTGASTSSSTSATPTPTGPITVQTLAGYTYLGCYSEATNNRALSDLQNPIPAANVSVNSCAAACSQYSYFGVEYSGECYCGNTINTGSAKVAGTTEAATGCNMICNANSLQYCGGPNRLNMYQVDTSANARVLLDSTTSTTTTSPTSSSSSTGLSTTGSSTTGSSTTTTQSGTTSPSSTTSSSTTSTTLSTTSTNSSPTSTLTSSTTSSSASTMQSSTSTSPTPTTTTSSSTTTPSSSTTTSSSSTTSPSSSTTTSKTSTTTSPTYSPTPGALFSTWSYLGCANETTPRALSSASYTSPTNMTLTSCLTFCASRTNNYALAGLENGNECYCGNGLQNYASPTYPTGCSTPCSGNKTQICGGPSRLSVWNSTGYIPPTTVRQVGTYLSQGCYPEPPQGGRLLTGKSYVNATGMTVESCVNFCSSTGAAYAGLEFGQECYCGASIPSTAQSTEIGRCNKLCSGNNREFCGGASLLNVYKDTPGSVSGDGTAKTANVVNEAVIQPKTTTTAAAKTKTKRRDVLGEGMERLRLRLRWERR